MRPQGTTLHLRQGGSLDFDLVVCADGYRSMGRRLIDPDATPRYRGMVLWRGLLHESDIRVDALGGCNGRRVVYRGGHGVVYYIPGSGRSTEPGKRLLMWGYAAAVQLGSVREGASGGQGGLRVPPRGPVAPLLFELVQRCGNSSIQAICSVAARSYAHDRVCLVGDAGAVFPPFTGSGVLRAVANATSLVDALADAPTIDDGLRRWGEAQAQVAAQVMAVAERIERSAVFDMPDLATMPTAAANDWMSAAHPGLVVTLPGV